MRDGRCPARQAAAVTDEILFHGIWQLALERGRNPCVQRCLRSEPAQRLRDWRGGFTRPCHHTRTCMPQPHGPIADFHVPRRPVRHIACLRWDSIGQAQLVRCGDAIGHDANTIAPREGCNRLVHVDRCRPLQDAAGAGKIVKPTADTTQITTLCQARQRLVDSRTATEVEEVLGGANPLPASLRTKALHDYIRNTSHLSGPRRPFLVRNIEDFSDEINSSPNAPLSPPSALPPPPPC